MWAMSKPVLRPARVSPDVCTWRRHTWGRGGPRAVSCRRSSSEKLAWTHAPPSRSQVTKPAPLRHTGGLGAADLHDINDEPAFIERERVVDREGSVLRGGAAAGGRPQRTGRRPHAWRTRTGIRCSSLNGLELGNTSQSPMPGRTPAVWAVTMRSMLAECSPVDSRLGGPWRSRPAPTALITFAIGGRFGP